MLPSYMKILASVRQSSTGLQACFLGVCGHEIHQRLAQLKDITGVLLNPVLPSEEGKRTIRKSSLQVFVSSTPSLPLEVYIDDQVQP